MSLASGYMWTAEPSPEDVMSCYYFFQQYSEMHKDFILHICSLECDQFFWKSGFQLSSRTHASVEVHVLWMHVCVLCCMHSVYECPHSVLWLFSNKYMCSVNVWAPMLHSVTSSCYANACQLTWETPPPWWWQWPQNWWCQVSDSVIPSHGTILQTWMILLLAAGRTTLPQSHSPAGLHLPPFVQPMWLLTHHTVALSPSPDGSLRLKYNRAILYSTMWCGTVPFRLCNKSQCNTNTEQYSTVPYHLCNKSQCNANRLMQHTTIPFM